MNLQRPIVFIDFETTGTDVTTARIVQMALIKINLDGSKVVKTHYVNPGVRIPAEATEIHGITDEMVKDAPTFREFAPKLYMFIYGCDLGGFNSNTYDFPLLYEEFRRSGTDWDYTKHHFVDVFKIYRHFFKRDLAAACREYLNTEMKDAHNAEADIRTTADIFAVQMRQHEDLSELSMAEVDAFCNDGKKRVDLSGKFYEQNGRVYYGFGKHKDSPAKQEPGFLTWMLKNDFPSDTKRICSEILQGMRD